KSVQKAKNKNTYNLLSFLMTWGIVLIAVGIILFIVEAADPGFFIAIPAGVLLTLGVIIIAFPEFELLSLWTPLIVAAVVIPLMFLSMRYYQYISPPSKPTTTMTSSLKGKKGIVVKKINPNDISGKVKVGDEIGGGWSATADEEIEEGEKVRIKESKGVHVVVERLDE
ncbi:MAG: NfeD family protein, partial [Candidatus Aenigmatarchaeota archaeon]